MDIAEVNGVRLWHGCHMVDRDDAGLDFFISHAGPDFEWAEWIGQQLVAAGHTVELDVWDWAAGSDFVVAMQNAVDRADRMIAVWSSKYFARTWTGMEAQTGLVDQERARAGWLVPVVVEKCDADIPRLYRSLIQINLVGLSEADARNRLLSRLAGPRRPTGRIPYPGVNERVLYPARLPVVWNLPRRNLFFTGRGDLLSQLTAQLSESAISVVDGPGGAGKSHLALEYAWRHATEYSLVWWINTKNRATAEADLAALAAVLDLPFRGGAATSIPVVLAELGRRTDWLLIYDNAPDLEFLNQLKPPGGGHVIVTCRESIVRHPAPTLHVGTFSRSESVDLLCRRAAHISASEASDVAVAAGDLPLAVAQAATHIAETGIEVAEYLRRLSAMTRSSSDGHPIAPGLTGTVAAALDELARLDPLALDLLHRLALLAEQAIPLTAMSNARLPGNGLVVADPATTYEIVHGITRLGLARSSGTHLHIHRQVQNLLLSRLEPARRDLVLIRALRLLGTATPGDPDNPADWPAYADLAAHVEAVTTHLADAHAAEPATFRRLLLGVCRYLYATGQTRASRALSEHTHRRFGRAYGEDHPDVLAAAHHLANAMHTLGDHDESHRLRADTLARRQQVLGVDHVDTLISANNLAVDLYDRGDHDAARVLDADTFDRRRRVLGEDHPHTLISANNLAADLRALGDALAARALDETTLRHRRRVLGEDHPDTLWSASGLARDLFLLGETDTARRMEEVTLDRRRALLGVDHPATLRSAGHLATYLRDRGENQAACDLDEDTYARCRRVLGENNPETLAIADGLVADYRALGRDEEAQALAYDSGQRKPQPGQAGAAAVPGVLNT